MTQRVQTVKGTTIMGLTLKNDNKKNCGDQRPLKKRGEIRKALRVGKQ